MLKACLVTAAVLLGATSIATGQTIRTEIPDEHVWATDGHVYDAEIGPDGNIYIAGDFSYVGPDTGHGVPVDSTTSKRARIYPKFEDEVNTCIPDGAGGWYVGGTFTAVGHERRFGLAHVMPDGTLDPNLTVGASGIDSLKLNGNTLFVGGYFDYVGTWHPWGAPLDRTSGVTQSGIDQPDDQVLAVVPDENGGWYIGGNFTLIGNTPRPYLAHILPSGKLDTQFVIDVDKPVQALALAGNTLYLGGRFGSVEGLPRSRLASVDVNTGTVSSLAPAVDGTVQEILVDGSTLYISGDFQNIGPDNRNYIAAINVNTGLPTSWNPNANASVRAMKLVGANLYIGGNFTLVGGASLNFLARVDAATGNVDTWDPGANNSIFDIESDGTTIWACGLFTEMNGTPRGRLAAFDNNSGSLLPWNPDANSSVYALHLAGGQLYAGGAFVNIGGADRRRIAEIDPATGTVGSWAPTVNGSVSAVTATSSKVYVGGNFTSIGGAIREAIAAINLKTNTVTSFNPGANDRVRAMEVISKTLYVVGDFTEIAGTSRNRIAALNASSGALLTWDPGADGSVLSMSISGSTAYLGGDFSLLGGANRANIGAVLLSTGEATAFDPAADLPVSMVIAGSSGPIYACGQFRNIGGAERHYLAALDADTGAATSWNPAPSPLVTKMALSGSTLYIAGNFAAVGGTPRRGAAAVHTATGDVLPWNPVCKDWAKFIATDGDHVFLCMNTGSVNGVARTGVAAIDPASGKATDFAPELDGEPVYALTFEQNQLFIGGNFRSANGRLRYGLAAYDISSGNLDSWDLATGYTIKSMVAESDVLYLGGSFTSTGKAVGGLIVLDRTSEEPLPNWPGTLSVIHAIEPDGSDGYFVAGSKLTFDGTVYSALVHILPDKSVDTSFLHDLGSGYIEDLAMIGSTLYAVGNFLTVNGNSRKFGAAFDTVSGDLLPWTPDASSIIHAIAPASTTLYIGGAFATVGGVSRSRIAEVDATTGAPTAWDPSANNEVKVLATDGNTVYAAGLFSSIGGASRTRFASIDPITGIANALDLNPSGTVDAILIDGNTVFVGGQFTNVQFKAAKGIARIDTTTDIATALNWPDLISVSSLALDDTELFAGGVFNNGSTNTYGLGSYSTLSDSANGLLLETDDTGHEILSEEDRLVYVGNHNVVDYQRRNRLAAFRISDESILDWNPSANGEVYHITLSGSTLYASGSFVFVSGNVRHSLVAADSATGVISNWDPFITPNSLRAAPVPVGSGVFIAGGFTKIGPTDRVGLAEVDNTDGDPTAWYLGDLPDWPIHLVRAGDYIFASGFQVDETWGEQRDHIFAIELPGRTLSSWNPGLNGQTTTGVEDAVVVDDTYYLVGGFASFHDEIRQGIVAIGPTRISEVFSTASDGTYKLGRKISIYIRFSRSVDVIGSPALLLETGDTDGSAVYSSGSGTNLLRFEYIVGPGEESLDLEVASINALELNGGTIIDVDGNAASLELPTLGGEESLGGTSELGVYGYSSGGGSGGGCVTSPGTADASWLLLLLALFLFRYRSRITGCWRSATYP